MSTMQPRSQDSPELPDLHLRSAAVRGSFWTILQVVFNKLGAAVATVVLAFSLEPSDYGIAWFAMTAGVFLLVFPVLSIGDVLISSPATFEANRVTARRLARNMAMLEAGLIACSGFILSTLYPDRHGLVGLMLVTATRPLAEALTVTPLAQLLVQLAYRRIAMIDAIASGLGSLLAIVLAVMDGGAFAIAAPPIVALALRGVGYRMTKQQPFSHSPCAADRTGFLRKAIPAAAGAYLNNSLFLTEMLLLGIFADTRSLGLFSFAFGLATQVSALLGFQIGYVLQPIISHLNHDPDRQRSAALRVVRLLAAIAIPILLAQAAIGGRVIGLLWPGKWDDAIATFQILSVGQIAGFGYALSAALIRAQGRFSLYYRAQLAQIIGSGLLYTSVLAIPISQWQAILPFGMSTQSLTPAIIAVAQAAVYFLAAPFLLGLACNRGGTLLHLALGCLYRPVIFATPIAALAYATAMTITPDQGGPLWQGFLLGALATISILIMTASTIFTHMDTRQEALRLLRRFFSRPTRLPIQPGD
jgi:O-antigen/teichoic acid export membrane protein